MYPGVSEVKGEDRGHILNKEEVYLPLLWHMHQSYLTRVY